MTSAQREAQRLRSRRHYLANSAKVNARSTAWKRAHAEQNRAAARHWNHTHREQRNATARRSYRRRKGPRLILNLAQGLTRRQRALLRARARAVVARPVVACALPIVQAMQRLRVVQEVSQT